MNNNQVFQRYLLGNFKAFKETQDIPLKPITLVFGPNSSGKSSLIHGLLMAHEAIRTDNLDVRQTLAGGKSVDLGGFEQYVHAQNLESDVRWGVIIDLCRVPQRIKEHLFPNVDSLDVSIYFGTETDHFGKAKNKPSVTLFEVYAGSEILLSLHGGNGTMTFSQLKHQHSIFHSNFEDNLRFFSDRIEKMIKVEEEAQQFKNNLQANLEAAMTTHLSDFPLSYPGLLPNKIVSFERLNLDDAYYETDFQKDHTNYKLIMDRFFVRTVFPFLQILSEQIIQEINRLYYIGPLREYPERHLDHSSQELSGNWRAGGGEAWAKVLEDTEVRTVVNEWLGSKFMQTKYELKVRHLVGLDQLKESLKKGLEEVISKQNTLQQTKASEDSKNSYEKDKAEKVFENLQQDEHVTNNEEREAELTNDPVYGLDEQIETIAQYINSSSRKILKDLILIDKRTNTEVTHRDVGFGISQTLPVLVTALGTEDQLIAIEQPEIHLHPALQSELGDVLIRSAKQKRNRLLIETHSEHLILRILKRMRETANKSVHEDLQIRPEDVCILFVRPVPNSASVVREIKLSQDGKFLSTWPGGFFEEGFRERLS